MPYWKALWPHACFEKIKFAAAWQASDSGYGKPHPGDSWVWQQVDVHLALQNTGPLFYKAGKSRCPIVRVRKIFGGVDGPKGNYYVGNSACKTEIRQKTLFLPHDSSEIQMLVPADSRKQLFPDGWDGMA